MGGAAPEAEVEDFPTGHSTVARQPGSPSFENLLVRPNTIDTTEERLISAEEFTTRHVSESDLEELLEGGGAPAVSIYLPTHRPNDQADADRIRFRGSLERARELLAGHEAADRLAGEMTDVEPLIRDTDFWRNQADGFALFLAPDFLRAFRLSGDVPELTMVGDAFHLLPLIERLQDPNRYWVLELGQERVRLWKGDAEGATRLNPEALPADLRDALELEFERDVMMVLTRKETDGSHGDHGRGGVMPVFHGHGQRGPGREEKILRKYCRRLDDALNEVLGKSRAPVILAAVDENQAVYRDASRTEMLAEEGIEGNVRYWSAEEIHEAAWPIARDQARETVDRALEIWERAGGSGKAESDVANLSHLAAQGRLRLLMVEKGRRVWGRRDPDTGDVEFAREGGQDPGPESVEILDALARAVLRHGGTVLPLSGERMPVETGAAGVLW